jgi:hypothetical protein
MVIPDTLKPALTEEIELPSGGTSRLPKCSPKFRPWLGLEIQDTYNGKQLLDAGGKPAFAELAILWALQEAGWDGVWIDTYRRVYRTGYWHTPPVPALPIPAARLLARIYEAAGSRNGAWDVFCWAGDQFLFAESKRNKKDSLRNSQKRWLEAALGVGLKSDNFLIVEWSVATP